MTEQHPNRAFALITSITGAVTLFFAVSWISYFLISATTTVPTVCSAPHPASAEIAQVAVEQTIEIDEAFLKWGTDVSETQALFERRANACASLECAVKTEKDWDKFLSESRTDLATKVAFNLFENYQELTKVLEVARKEKQ